MNTLNKARLTFFVLIFSTFLLISFKSNITNNTYLSFYILKIENFNNKQSKLLDAIKAEDFTKPQTKEAIIKLIHQTRISLKGTDIWLRYLEPLAYKKINSPLPVEWETEVFEKYEKPYKRVGAGLTLAELHFDEESIIKDTLIRLIQTSIEGTKTFTADSILERMKTHHHFYLCNRLFLLNLAAIYTTGFECPDTSIIIPELREMLKEVNDLYRVYNECFPETPLTVPYLELFKNTITFVNAQPSEYTLFDHFTFIKNFVNPLYAINQELISNYKVSSRSPVDYSLNKTNRSIFNKSLYYGQNTKGVFMDVTDEKVLAEIDRVGKLLFYDPVLSANNQRTCVSCHKTKEFFTDTIASTSLQFDHKNKLQRNTPTLLNVEFNHLIMLDGKHISLQNQTKDVITNHIELSGKEQEVLEKVLSCSVYKKSFRSLLKYTPKYKEVSFDHIVSSITFYYSKFSNYYSPFDRAMDENKHLDKSAKLGFNIFMGKAQCATCHFVPQFNGVKPSYIGSEFEVLGVPADLGYHELSPDKGRYLVNPAKETMNAFRTGTLRNIANTKPYMHNGIFSSLEEVIDFYDMGGGAGKGLNVPNQTLSSEKLNLSVNDKANLVNFMKSLTEDINFENPPLTLPISKNKILNNRKVGGEY